MLNNLNVVQSFSSSDGATKLVFELKDENLIETVRIPQHDEVKLCISSQVGCIHKCRFCRSGGLHFERNLTAEEICSQIASVASRYGDDTSNYHILFMGMGEPFYNYSSLLNSIYLMTSDHFSVKDITVSTSGVPSAIYQFANENITPTLAVSVVTTEQSLREDLMPHSKYFSVNQLFEAVSYYQRNKDKEVILEYVLLDNVNDDHELICYFLEMVINYSINAEVQFIPFNSAPELPFSRPSNDKIQKTLSFAKSIYPNTIIKKSFADDIFGGCGQLLTNSIKKSNLDVAQCKMVCRCGGSKQKPYCDRTHLDAIEERG